MTLLDLTLGNYSLLDEKLEPGSPAIGKQIIQLQLPSNCSFFGFIRYGEIVLPLWITVLEVEDEVPALVDNAVRGPLAQLLSRSETK